MSPTVVSTRSDLSHLEYGSGVSSPSQFGPPAKKKLPAPPAARKPRKVSPDGKIESVRAGPVPRQPSLDQS
jgi:hypothetical protein